MTVETTFEKLAASFAECRISVPGGRLYRPADPLELDRAFGATVTARLLRERVESLVEFAWSEPHLRPTVTLGLLSVGTRGGVLCLYRRHESTTAVAAVVAEGVASIVSLFFVDLLGSNGSAYGVGVFDRLPVLIVNRRPELVRRAFVTQALCAWLRWADRTGGEPWPMLHSDVTERWGRDDWGELTLPEERRSLLRVCLAISYVERRSGIRLSPHGTLLRPPSIPRRTAADARDAR